eukprot:jgi/Tetstr1/446341/TSEL_033883.t1
MSEIDRIDRLLLSELRRDADIGNARLADRVGLSPSACLRRYRASFHRKLREEPAVSMAYSVSGDVSAVLQVDVADMAAFNALTARLFDDDPNVAAFTTHFIMGTVKQEPVVPATSRPVAAP